MPKDQQEEGKPEGAVEVASASKETDAIEVSDLVKR